MKVLMLTSELWPVFSGGLGIAIYELVKAFEQNFSDIKFRVIIPGLEWSGDLKSKVIETSSLGFSVYFYKGEPVLDWDSLKSIYDFNLALVKTSEKEKFDVVHVNDWMTVPAGIMLKERGIPFVFHIHSTEYDRTNNNPRSWVVEMERMGAEKADTVVANSYRTKQQLVDVYGISPDKIEVVYNGINIEKFKRTLRRSIKKPGGDVVLFVGRLTVQKGLWHLLHTARQVIDKKPKTKFVIVGSGGDMKHLIKTSIHLGIERNIIFTGKISEDELLAAYRLCDVFVMPSVNEPFGLVALEALAAGKPVILSKTAGVCEVVEHCFKVDYWDTNLMASRILEVLHYKELKVAMGQNGYSEAKKLSWKSSAKKMRDIYRGMLHA